MIVRLGGMSDCFAPVELRERVTRETIKLLNRHKIGYLIVTKSHIVANKEYIELFDKELAHIQITVTCFDDEKARSYEKASVPSKRLEAILKLQEAGFDVAIRLSPLLEEYMDFDKLNKMKIDKCVVEFLRVNSWIKQWFPDIDYSRYTLRQSNYNHLPLDEKMRILQKIHIGNMTVPSIMNIGKSILTQIQTTVVICVYRKHIMFR